MHVLDGPADPTFRRRLLWAGLLAGLLPMAFAAHLMGLGEDDNP